jgi:hypothetical protein
MRKHNLRRQTDKALIRLTERADGHKDDSTVGLFEFCLAPFQAKGGVWLRRQALEAGFSDDEIRAHLRAGVWRRIRRGAYADAVVWDSLDAAGRHVLRCRAVVASLDPPVVLSHWSAAVALGLPVWAVDLNLVHVTRPGPHSRARREAGVVHHVAHLDADEVVIADGLRVTRADRTVVDVARAAGFEPGVVTADAALHRRLTTPDALLARAIALQDWPGGRVCGRVVAFADGTSESVGESRTRVLFRTHGLPTPELQVEIRDGGALVARVDFLLDDCLVGEFDGRVKYRLDGLVGGQLEDVLWMEKRRQDRIVGLGYEVERAVWGDLDRPAATARRFWAALERARARRGRGGLTA